MGQKLPSGVSTYLGRRYNKHKKSMQELNTLDLAVHIKESGIQMHSIFCGFKVEQMYVDRSVMNRTSDAMKPSNYPAFLLFHDWQNCFAYTRNASSQEEIPSVSSRTNPTSSLGHFRIRSCENSRQLYVQVYGCFPFTYVFVNRRLADLAKFRSNEEVILEHIQPTICTAVEIVPLSQHDYEILDRSSGEVEEVFLQQIQLVVTNMKFPLWVSPSVCASFRVENVLPTTSEPVLLLPSTELHILSVAEALNSSEKDVCGNVVKISSAFPTVSGSESLNYFCCPMKFHERPFRVLPNSLCERSFANDSSHPNVIYVLGEEVTTYTACGIVAMKTHPNSSEEEFQLVVAVPPVSISSGLNLKSISGVLKSYNKPCHCIFPSKDHLAYSTIWLTSLERQFVKTLTSVDVSFSKEDMEWIFHNSRKDDVHEALRDIVSVHPILIPLDGLLLTASIRGRQVMVHVSPSSGEKVSEGPRQAKSSCFIVNAACAFKLKSEPSASLPSSNPSSEPENYGFVQHDPFIDFESQHALVNELVSWASYSWSHKGFGHALLLGPEGSGKTSVAALLSHKLAKSQCCLSVRIDCSSWKGKQSEQIEKSVDAEITSLSTRVPSLLILDDFDFLSVFNEEEQRQLAVERVFEMLRRVLFATTVPVLVIAKHLKSLHKSIVNPGGRRIFSLTKTIPPLTQIDRQHLLNGFLGPDYDSTNAAKVTENLSLTDMRHLAMRTRIEAKIRDPTSPILRCDFDKALSYSRPDLSAASKAKHEVKVTLDDVGGLAAAKRTLQEVLIWPFKYPEVFESYGISLGKGVLLHGASGCGKTLLANAIATHSKFNSIFVKGPELFSKYIGSSEENVRRVFERARASSPCVIIFDELDSLAQQRGSDSSGVTDRVVNQLLTEMDGVEGKSGVFVIGCSSRMDLIDSALLRPGRFDYILECPMPDKEDRSDILRVHLRSVKHSSDVNPDQWAARTDGWTGADLKALITNAQFDALRGRPISLQEQTIITNSNIEAVFKESCPKRLSRPRKAFRVGEQLTLE